MPKSIPKGLEKEHVLAAMRDLDDGVNHGFGTPTKFSVLYQGKQYPPKAVVGLAFKYLRGSILLAHEFSGGEAVGQANFELRQLGFDVVPLTEAENSLSSRAEWTQVEIDAAVVAYLEMLRQEKLGRSYNKAATNRELRAGELSNRTRGSVEMRMCNISSVMKSMGYEYIDGYKPRSNVGKHIVPKIQSSLRKHISSLAAFRIVDATALENGQERLPGEIAEDEQIAEGSVKRVTVNSYERSVKARRICLELYGYNCVVCGFNFEEVFGELGKGFIHVHHLKELSSIGEEYVVDPKIDLRPVCPNCHAMLHKGESLLTIEELVEIRQS